jgi:hypothetical protein
MLLTQQATDMHIATLRRRLGALKAYAQSVPRYVDSSQGRIDNRISEQTLTFIPFNLNRVQETLSLSSIESERTLRILFFEVTVWSVYRYFLHMVVGDASGEDMHLLRSLDLPVKRSDGKEELAIKLIDLSKTFHFEGHQILSYKMLPKVLMLHISDILKVHPKWASYRYVYYTEADHGIGSSFTSTCGSAHQARCRYSRARVTCPRPPACREHESTGGAGYLYRGEIDNIEFG